MKEVNMKTFQTLFALATLGVVGAFTSGCYTRAGFYEPAGAEVYTDTYYPDYYYDGGTIYYYDHRQDYRSPRDEHRWELHRDYRHDTYHKRDVHHDNKWDHHR
jgi:hypothetical protein